MLVLAQGLSLAPSTHMETLSLASSRRADTPQPCMWSTHIHKHTFVFSRANLTLSHLKIFVPSPIWDRVLGLCVIPAASVSALFLSFASGCVALPVLMNIKAVIEQRQCTGVWSHKDELPVRAGCWGGTPRSRCWAHGSDKNLTQPLLPPD